MSSSAKRARSRRGVVATSRVKTRAKAESVVGPPPSSSYTLNNTDSDSNNNNIKERSYSIIMKRIGRASGRRRTITTHKTKAKNKPSKSSSRPTSPSPRPPPRRNKNASHVEKPTQTMGQANEAAAIGQRHRQNLELVEQEKQRQLLVDEEKARVKAKEERIAQNAKEAMFWKNRERAARHPKRNRALKLTTPKHHLRMNQARKQFKMRTHPAYNNLLQFVFQVAKGEHGKAPFLRAGLVWYPHPLEGFCPAKVIETFDVNSVGHMVIIDKGEAKPVVVSRKQSRSLMCMDPASVQPLENMTELKHLNEASILYNLKLRFQQKSPYTVIGAPSVAADPSAMTNNSAGGGVRQGSMGPIGATSCFSDSTIVLLNTFKEPTVNVRMYIRRVCYNMLSSMVATRRHQAVLFAGESGSGKTHFSREFVYRLVMLRKKHKESNLILLGTIKAVYGVLDAFVTAKTLRNRKSTRGSKSVELIHTLGSGKAVGARVKLFFLDGSRVVSRRRGEENFAVLYQVRAHAKANKEFADQTMLLPQENQDSPYLSTKANNNGAAPGDERSTAPTRKSGGNSNNNNSKTELTKEEENDSTRWGRLVEHLKVDLGVTDAAMECVARLLATVLNLGCIRFVGPESAHLYETGPAGAHGNETIEVVDTKVVCTVAAQLGISGELLEHVLTVKDIKAGHETLTRPLTVGQSELVRDVLAKRIYQRVITFIQVILNRALSPPRGGDMDMLFWDRVGAVKLLDMVPFEAFERSSFEHLCSNYYNEGINLQYQAFVARMEQQRVLNITQPVTPHQSGSFKGSSRNQQPFITVKMLEKQMAELTDSSVPSYVARRREHDEGVFPLFSNAKTGGRLGVFDVINEVGRLREGASDAKVLQKMQSRFPAHAKYVRRPKHNTAQFKDCFAILHYAGAVNYDVAGFLVKNLQSLPQVLELALWNSSSQAVRELVMLAKDYGLTQASKSPKNRMGISRNKQGATAGAVPRVLERTEGWQPAWEKMSPGLRATGGKAGSTTKSGALHEHDDALSVMSGAHSFGNNTDDNDGVSNPIELDADAASKAAAEMRLSMVKEERSRRGVGAEAVSVKGGQAATIAEEDERHSLRRISSRIRWAARRATQTLSSSRLGAGHSPTRSSHKANKLKKRKRPVSIQKLTQSFKVEVKGPGRITNGTSALEYLLKEYDELVEDLELNTNASPARVPLSQSGHSLHLAHGHDVRFVKCVKANNMRVPGLFDDRVVLSQLRKVGLVDLCRIRDIVGFPVQFDFVSFMKEYMVFYPRALMKPMHSREDVVKTIEDMCKNLTRMGLMEPDSHGEKYLIGPTSVLLKLDTYRLLEVAKDHATTDMAIFIQKQARHYIYRQRFLKIMTTKVEMELEAATELNDIPLITKWMNTAKAFKIFTLPYYQAIGRLERLFKEQAVCEELKRAVKTKDPIELYNAVRQAREMYMDGSRYPELNAALKCQAKIEAELRGEYDVRLEEYKGNYRGVLDQLGGHLEGLKTVRAFEDYEREQNRATMAKIPKHKGSRASKSGSLGGDERGSMRRYNEAKAMPGIKLDSAFLERFYRKVNAKSKIQEISFILRYFDGRPDDLLGVLESKYNIVFKKDGSFVRAGAEPEKVEASVRENNRKSVFIRDLATARGVAAQSVRINFSSQVPKNKVVFDEDDDDDDEDSIEDAAYEDERWAGGGGDTASDAGSVQRWPTT